MTLLTIAGTKPLIPKSMMVLFVATKRDLARDKLNLYLCHGTQDVKLKRDWITNSANWSGYMGTQLDRHHRALAAPSFLEPSRDDCKIIHFRLSQFMVCLKERIS